jgi:hypothetical protein
MAETTSSEKAEPPSDKGTKPSVAKEAAPAKKTVPAKKIAPELKPFVDNGNGTVTDPNTGLIWKKTDAWLDTHKFYTWQDHRIYVDKVNKEKYAEIDSWRIPNKQEASTLVDKTGTKSCEDKNGTMFPLDPIFDAGCVANTWISECSDESIIRYDLKIGLDTPYPGNDVWSSMRLVSKPGEASATIGAETAPIKQVVEDEKPPVKASSGSPAEATAKPSGGSVPHPAKRDVTEEEKAVFKARAKAWAQKKKK